MGLFVNIFPQGAVLHINYMQAPSKPPVKLVSSLAVKKSPSPLTISPCMGELPVKLASSWQERQLVAGPMCRSAGLTQQGRNRHWCRQDAGRTRQFDQRVEVQFFFIKHNICGSRMHAFLSSVCISLTAFVSSHIPASIAFFLLLVLRVLVSIVLTENFKFFCVIYMLS